MKLYPVSYFFGDFKLKLEETSTRTTAAIAFFTNRMVYSWSHPVSATVRNLVRLEEV